MFSLTGHILMGLACAFALGLAVGGFRCTIGRAKLVRIAFGHLAILIFAMATLVTAFVVSDFSLSAVYSNSHTEKPLFFRIAGSWGNHEGSMLLWALLSGAYLWLFARFAGGLPDRLVSLTVGFAATATLGVNAFVATVSSPFVKMPLPIPVQGRDLNPLLQDVGLVIHPPMLYVGYVGLLIPWALACAALMQRTDAKTWARAVKPFAYLSLAFLTTGIMLGSWWAYRELGWGGWWFWDPVENVSVIPWLLGIALAHSAISAGKRGTLVGWSMALAILAYGATLLGTFLVRSGTLVSVHAFAADPGRGVAILIYFSVLVGGGLILLAAYLPRSAKVTEGLASRDTAMRFQNVLIIAMAATILLGTIYPPLLQALGQAPLAIGAPYYTVSVIPLVVLTLMIMAVATSLNWRGGWIGPHRNLLWGAAVAGVLSGAGMFLWKADWLSALIIGAGIGLFIVGFRKRPAVESDAARTTNWATRISHTGVAIFALAAAFGHVFGIEADRELAVGESFEVEGYTVRMEAIREGRGPNYVSALADMTINERVKLTPEYRYYPVRDVPTTEADIDSNLIRDLRITLNLVDGTGGNPVWAVRFHRKPGMMWLWISTLIISLGLGLSARQAFRAL